MIRNFLWLTAAMVVTSFVAAPASAQFGQGNSPNNLFSQYSTEPGSSMTQAGMYPAPHYVPRNVGHTYYTYQALMPHEMMYQHSRNYYNYYNTGGYYRGSDALNKTQIRWQSGNNHMGPMPFSGAAFQSLQWKWNKGRYCLRGEDGSCLGGGSGSGGRGGLRHGRLRHSGGGGCAGGNCGDGYSYEGASYDAGYGGGYDTGEIIGEGAIGGGCASGSCAAKDSEEDTVQR